MTDGYVGFTDDYPTADVFKAAVEEEMGQPVVDKTVMAWAHPAGNHYNVDYTPRPGARSVWVMAGDL